MKLFSELIYRREVEFGVAPPSESGIAIICNPFV